MSYAPALRSIPEHEKDCRPNPKIFFNMGEPYKVVLLIAALAFGFVALGFAQSMSAAEQDVLQIRQKMSSKFAEAIKKKDVSLIADHYSKDAVYSVLSPSRTILVGRDAIVKRFDEIFKTDPLIYYLSKPDEVHLSGESIAWSTGTYALTTMAKDGTKREFHGNWLDMMKRESDGEWRITFQANASIPNQ
jgi:uncharacterized protein (TIGR02246 family)